MLDSCPVVGMQLIEKFLHVTVELPAVNDLVILIKFAIGKHPLLFFLVDFQLLPVGEHIVHVGLNTPSSFPAPLTPPAAPSWWRFWNTADKAHRGLV